MCIASDMKQELARSNSVASQGCWHQVRRLMAHWPDFKLIFFFHHCITVGSLLEHVSTISHISQCVNETLVIPAALCLLACAHWSFGPVGIQVQDFQRLCRDFLEKGLKMGVLRSPGSRVFRPLASRRYCSVASKTI